MTRLTISKPFSLGKSHIIDGLQIKTSQLKELDLQLLVWYQIYLMSMNNNFINIAIVYTKLGLCTDTGHAVIIHAVYYAVGIVRLEINFLSTFNDDGHMYFMAIFMRNSKWIDTKFTESGSVKTRTNSQKITHTFIN